MDLQRHEFRRQLRAVDEAHVAAMKPWREALLRIFAGDEQATTATKTQLTGAPDRRSFLRVSAFTVAGAAVLAACGDDNTQGSQSGTTQPTTSTTANTGGPTSAATVTTGPPTADDKKTDLALLRTATSVELLAVAVYGQAAPLIKDPDVLAAAKLFATQHQEHAQQLQAGDEGGFGADKVYKKPNAVLKKDLVDPVLPTLLNDKDIAGFAMQLEDAAAATYVTAAGELTTAKLRQALMAIGGVEARHSAILASVVGTSVPTMAFWSLADTVSSDAFV